MNQPYVKQFNKNGEEVNPITKTSPYLNLEGSNRGNRENHRPINNRKYTKGRLKRKQVLTKIVENTPSLVAFPHRDSNGRIMKRETIMIPKLGSRFIVHENLSRKGK